MEDKIIVFDFDKTLTYKDTLLGFYLFSSKRDVFFPFKITIYFFYMILTKLNFISNTKLKCLGVKLFLKNITKTKITKLSKEYSKRIKLNKLFHNFDFLSNNNIVIISASFKEYLTPIFNAKNTVYGSEIKYVDNKVNSLKYNCYGKNKLNLLLKKNINAIDVLYTDSLSDCSIAKISKKIIVVKNDNYFECSNYEEFLNFFNK